jgi:hypothetical protein
VRRSESSQMSSCSQKESGLPSSSILALSPRLLQKTKRIHAPSWRFAEGGLGGDFQSPPI